MSTQFALRWQQQQQHQQQNLALQVRWHLRLGTREPNEEWRFGATYRSYILPHGAHAVHCHSIVHTCAPFATIWRLALCLYYDGVVEIECERHSRVMIQRTIERQESARACAWLSSSDCMPVSQLKFHVPTDLIKSLCTPTSTSAAQHIGLEFIMATCEWLIHMRIYAQPLLYNLSSLKCIAQAQQYELGQRAPPTHPQPAAQFRN